MREALSQIEAEHGRVLSIRTVRPTLEDVFVRMTGLSAEVMLEESGGRGQRDAKG